ncbi:unnamed protein product [Polarella glacialis]|uniref:Uncharacterized protein n=1 Tax=Polarella glacialis TaxID=89957 RepID=A0A813LVQ5_POLGL|nr:unnamed protein product [Polarella glacialis]CAE8740153.1 unnamed protein product [Polarella glacialis]
MPKYCINPLQLGSAPAARGHPALWQQHVTLENKLSTVTVCRLVSKFVQQHELALQYLLRQMFGASCCDNSFVGNTRCVGMRNATNAPKASEVKAFLLLAVSLQQTQSSDRVTEKRLSIQQ